MSIIRTVHKQESTQSDMVQVSYHRKKFIRAVDVAQLVEQSHPTPEIHRLNPDIDKVVSTNLYSRKDKNKEKEAGNGRSLKKVSHGLDSSSNPTKNQFLNPPIL